MYLPSSFAESDPARLWDLIEEQSFGVLFSNHEGRPFATHLPLLLERDAGPHGALVGHMARANPQWRSAAGQRVLAVFSGPHTYISPAWYEAQGVVPTWNYVAVHVEGIFQTVDELPASIETVARTVAQYEGDPATGQAWSFDPADPYIERMAQQIVSFRIPIDRIEGKWKLSQNQPRERQAKVARALERRTDENSQAIAALIRERLASEPAKESP
jgi:transcriptional regulator